MRGAFKGVITAYPTPESLEAKVREYFDWCFIRKYDKNLGREVERVFKAPTMAGLARYLGFTSVQQLQRYQEDPNELYGEILAGAKLRIQQFLEEELTMRKGSTDGLKFLAKNHFGMADQVQTQLLGEDGGPVVFGWAKHSPDVLAEAEAERMPAPAKELPRPAAEPAGKEA